jgi:hypothetical protein
MIHDTVGDCDGLADIHHFVILAEEVDPWVPEVSWVKVEQPIEVTTSSAWPLGVRGRTLTIAPKTIISSPMVWILFRRRMLIEFAFDNGRRTVFAFRGELPGTNGFCR